ncbi:MAG: Uma2 family endonuclease [Planctomycetes bacterium]|nr:Uma2 family endonuclease [Planctomycetota bacterium]
MATVITTPSSGKLPKGAQARLQNGDRLTRDEFERRYEADPTLKKAELIEGVVYVPSPVRFDQHGKQHFNLITWLGLFVIQTPGVEGGDNSSLRLDLDNEPQPDAHLMIKPELGGQAKIDDEGYIVAAPELVAEVAASSVSYDLHTKLNVYRRIGVKEYIVWRVEDEAIDWFVLRQGKYERFATVESVYRSEVFPGLWLDPQALVSGDLAQVAKIVQQGMDTNEHREFVARLKAKKG